jgi:cytochrome c5
LTLATVVLACAGWSARAQERSAPKPAEAEQAPAKDYNQRSLEIFEFRKAAKSGVRRGEEMFYYKCWFCHNEYVPGAPRLEGLFQRQKLISGQPVSDETVRQKILEGGPGMAAYKHTLGEGDLDDLMTYLKEACCWDSSSPPRNPRYKGQ